MTDAQNLKGHQRKYLRGLAHPLKPIILIGQKGVTPSVENVLDQALTDHELVKVKFVEGKEKANKKQMAARLENATSCQLVGHIGHTVIFFRPHPEVDKRKIRLPHGNSS